METYSMPSSSPRAELSYLPLHHLQSVPADSKLMSTHREMFCHSTNSLQRNSLVSSGVELEIKSNGAAFNSTGDHSGVSSEKHWVKMGTGPDTDRHRDGNKVLAEMQGGDDGDEEDEEGKYGASGGKKKGEKKVRRPRFAFHTRSQVDILDDGYRWRKYGQKAVKNNNFPRSYYRCTHQGCSVKKQVQRLSKDEEVVVTTYEGTHTHPIERNTDNFEQILNQMQIYTRF